MSLDVNNAQIAAALSVKRGPLAEMAFAPADQLPPAPSRRLLSLDVFRGITIAGMLLVNNPGPGKAYAPLEHAAWHGWTPTDLIFPFFLFIVGVAIPFSMAKRAAMAGSKMRLLGGIWLRALSLVFLGALLQGMPFPTGSSPIDPVPPQFQVLFILRLTVIVFIILGIFALLYPGPRGKAFSILIPAIGLLYVFLLFVIHNANWQALQTGLPASFNFGNGALTPYKFRIPGVLQRIGVCYGLAATIALFTGWRTILLSIVILLASYSWMMYRLPFENHQTGSLTREDNLARRVDEKVFRTHAYGSYPDPEGLLSTIPATATPLVGVLVGLWLRTRRPASERCAALLSMGVFVTILGMCLHSWLMPINKQIWTPSFVVFCGGMGMLGLGAIFWLVDVAGYKRWALPFTIYGMNAIAAFVAAGIVTRMLYILHVTVDGKSVTLSTFVRTHIADAVHQANAWVQAHWAFLPPIDGPGNTSLAYSLAYVLFILILMSGLYVTKTFVKV